MRGRRRRPGGRWRRRRGAGPALRSARGSPSPRRRVRADNFAGRHPALAVAAVVALLLVGGLLLVWLTSPDASEFAREWPERTAFMELRIDQAREEGRELEPAYRPLPLSRIPQHLQRAVLAAEDAAFWSHGGFDWEQIRYAIRKAWEEKSVSRGASTITQQLAKNLYLSPSRNPVRKLREAVSAWKMERTLPKRRILELYLNVAEFGPGVFGVEAASRRYFGTGVSAVGPSQAAMLAATLPSPLRNNPATDTGRFRWRTALIGRLAFGSAEERIEITPPPRAAIEVRDPFAPPPLADTLEVVPAPATPLFPVAPDTARPDTVADGGAPARNGMAPAADDAAPAADTAGPPLSLRAAVPVRAPAGRRAPTSPAARAGSRGSPPPAA